MISGGRSLILEKGRSVTGVFCLMTRKYIERVKILAHKLFFLKTYCFSRIIYNLNRERISQMTRSYADLRNTVAR